MRNDDLRRLLIAVAALAIGWSVHALAQERRPAGPPNAGAAEALELVALQLRIDDVLGSDVAQLEAAWKAAVARPDRGAAGRALQQSAERLFALVAARLAANGSLSPADRAAATAGLAEARSLFASAHGADGDRAPGLMRALDALAIADPMAPRVQLRSVRTDVEEWQASAPPPPRADMGAPTLPGTFTSPIALTWIGFGPDRVGVRGPARDGQPDAEFEIRYARGVQIVQMVNLSMASPTGQLCCQAWSTAGQQFHFLGVGAPGSPAVGNAAGFSPQLGYAPETLRLYAPAPQWFTPGWRVVATVVFADGTYISGSTVVGGGAAGTVAMVR